MAEFKFFCPQCGQHIQCDTSYSGGQINCPVCQQVIVVPPPPRAAGAQPVPVKPQTLRKVLVIVASVVALAGLIVVGWFGYSKIRIHILAGHLPPGLVALWSGDGNGKDSAGWNNATLTDITFAKGNVGQAFRFNGKSSSIKILASPSLDVGAGDGFTITAWIKPSNVQGIHPLFEWLKNGIEDDNAVQLWIGAQPGENGVFRGNIPGGDGNGWLVSQQGVLTSGVFQHIAMTYDKASGMSVLYVNGVMVAQHQLSRQIVAGTKGDFGISWRDDRPGGWLTGRTFSGLMDDIGLYNRALSASEIQAICTEQNHGEPLTLPDPSTGWLELMR